MIHCLEWIFLLMVAVSGGICWYGLARGGAEQMKKQCWEQGMGNTLG